MSSADVPRLRLPSSVFRPLAAILSGLLLVAAHAPFSFWPAAVLGVALLSVAVHGVRPRRAALLGLLAGLSLFVPLLSWIRVVPEAGTAPWMVLSLLEALFFAALASALALVSRLRYWPLLAASLWVLQEAARGRLPWGGLSWGRLAFTQSDSPLTPLVSVVTAPGLTFLVALLGSLLAAVLLSRSLRSSLVLLSGTGLLLASSLFVAAGPDVSGQTVTVAVVQGNVPEDRLVLAEQRLAVVRNHAAATRRLAGDVRAGRVPAPDLVVWPENASDVDPLRSQEVGALVDGAVRAVGVPVLVGTLLDAPGGGVKNAGVVWDPVTGPGEVYVKQHLVPFGEYLPHRARLGSFLPGADRVQDIVPGDDPGILQVGPVTVGDVICFEVGYDALVREAVRGGGGLVVVQTNNASFGRTSQSEQQFAMGRLRAVEHGRPLVAAATSGVSGVVSAQGDVLSRTDLFTQEVLVEEVVLGDRLTPATRLGAWPELLLSLLASLLLLSALAHRHGVPVRRASSSLASSAQV